MADVSRIKLPDGNTYNIKDTVSGYVTGMTTTAGSHIAGAQTVTSGIITTNIPTKTSHLTNDSGFITTDSDEKLKTTSLSTGTTSYLLSGPAETTAANKYYVPDITAYRNSSGPTYLTVGSASGAYAGGLGLANTGASNGQTIINPSATSNIILTLPNATGTIALTSDIPSITDTQVTNTAVTAATTYYLTGSSSPATATGELNKHAAIWAYVEANTSTSGSAYIVIGNPTASGTAGSKYGSIRLYGSTAYYTELRNYSTTNPTSNRFCYLPRYAGTQYLTCVSTASAVGGSNQATYVNNKGQIVAGNSFVPTTGGAFSGAVTAAASDGTTAQIANIKYGSAAPSGTATTGTVYFKTGASPYTFQPRVNLTKTTTPALPDTITTTTTEMHRFTLPPGLYLITFQINYGGGYTEGTCRWDLKAGANTITQVRAAPGTTSGLIQNGCGLVQCTDASTTISFTAAVSSGSMSTGELHYSYIKLF